MLLCGVPSPVRQLLSYAVLLQSRLQLQYVVSLQAIGTTLRYQFGCQFIGVVCQSILVFLSRDSYFFLDCIHLQVFVNFIVSDKPMGVCNCSQDDVLKSLYYGDVRITCCTPQLYAIQPDGLEDRFIYQQLVISRQFTVSSKQPVQQSISDVYFFSFSFQIVS